SRRRLEKRRGAGSPLSAPPQYPNPGSETFIPAAGAPVPRVGMKKGRGPYDSEHIPRGAKAMQKTARYFTYPLLLGLLAVLTPDASFAEVADTAPMVVAGQFIEAQTTGSVWEAVYSFRWQGQLVEISAEGRFSTRDGSRTVRHELTFSSDPEDWIEKLYVAEVQNDLVLIGEVGNEESGAGFVTRLARSGFSRRWLTSMPGFNVGNALLRERYAYVSAIGFVGKLDLNTGRYAWQKKDLYSKNEAFNNFATPFVEGTSIVFVGEGGTWPKNNEIVIDDLSGKI